MAKKVEIVLNSAGIAELMKGEEFQQYFTELGGNVRSRCTGGSAGPDEFEVEVKTKRDRVAAVIRTATPRAFYSNRKHHTLEKAVFSK